MRISCFLMSYPPRRFIGSELMTASILEAFVEAGHEVSVFTDIGTESYERNGVQVKPRSAFNRVKPGADVIISHPDLGTIAYVVSRMHRIPYIAIVHNTGETNRWHLEHHTPDLIVWNAVATQEAFGNKTGLVVHSPLRVKDYRVKKTGDSFTLINLIEPKGVNTFIALAKRTKFPALGIAGGYGNQAMAACKKAGIKTHPPIPHDQMGKAVWSKTKVLLAPSDYESWGRVAAEALCSGIPVIAHPTPGLQECLGEAGIFIDRADIDSWESQLSELMTNPDAYEKASQLALHRARQLEAISQAQLSKLIQAAELLALRPRK